MHQWFRRELCVVGGRSELETVMREEFLEPLPSIQKSATLMLGSEAVKCFVVEATTSEFRIAVPGIRQYEGDPKLTLMTSNAVFPVKLIRQEAHSGGYAFRLQRLELENKVTTRLSTRRARFLTSGFYATGVLAVIIAGSFYVPTINDDIPLLRLQGRRTQTLGWWAPSVNENDSAPVSGPSPGSEVANPLHRQDQRDTGVESSTIVVSMISPVSPSLTAPSLLPAETASAAEMVTTKPQQHGNSKPANAKQTASLNSQLKEGESGRIQYVTQKQIPWIYAGWPAGQPLNMRASDAALQDLKQFEQGLRELPQETSAQAIASLQNVLRSATRQANQANRVLGTTDTYVVSTDDARVYFHAAQGQLELVRVLPID